MRRALPLIILYFDLVSRIQAQRNPEQYHRSRPVFQSFDSRFPGGSSSSSSHISSDGASDLATQLRFGSPEFQEQPRRDNDAAAGLPLYKQSYPGLYVKGHTVENFKYEPTRQVEHHHGPNYQLPRNIAQSARHSPQGFGGNGFSGFGN